MPRPSTWPAEDITKLKQLVAERAGYGNGKGAHDFMPALAAKLGRKHSAIAAKIDMLRRRGEIADWQPPKKNSRR